MEEVPGVVVLLQHNLVLTSIVFFVLVYFLTLELKGGNPPWLLVRYNRKQHSKRIFGLIFFQLGIADWLSDSCAHNCWPFACHWLLSRHNMLLSNGTTHWVHFHVFRLEIVCCSPRWRGCILGKTGDHYPSVTDMKPVHQHCPHWGCGHIGRRWSILGESSFFAPPRQDPWQILLGSTHLLRSLDSNRSKIFFFS